MGVQKYLLSSALEGVISQKLARKLCPHCKVKRPATDYEKQIIKSVLNIDVTELYDVEGCENCNNGFSGRIAIHEVLIINQKIRDALSNNVSKETLRDLVYKDSDVTTLLQDGIMKVVNGLTTFEEILKIIELEDDEKISDNFNLKEALSLTKKAQAAEELKIFEKADKADERHSIYDNVENNNKTDLTK
jgi:type IV pilus assembly protein PilB